MKKQKKKKKKKQQEQAYLITRADARASHKVLYLGLSQPWAARTITSKILIIVIFHSRRNLPSVENVKQQWPAALLKFKVRNHEQFSQKKKKTRAVSSELIHCDPAFLARCIWHVRADIGGRATLITRRCQVGVASLRPHFLCTISSPTSRPAGLSPT